MLFAVQRIISGGQTGVDPIWLVVANELGTFAGEFSLEELSTETGFNRPLEADYGSTSTY